MAENGDDERPRPLQLAVVGARGFLGRNLLASARAAGHSVIEYEVDTPPIREQALADGLADSEVVYWLASRCNPATAESNPELARADIDEFAEFLRLIGRLQRVPRVVLASSGGTIYGNGEPPFREDSPLTPTGRYGASKKAAEEALWASGVPGVAARISNPYGPGQRPGTGQGVVAQWLDDILSGRTPTLIGSPRTARDFVYVGDIADGLVALGLSDFTGPLNLGGGRPTTLEELAATLSQVAGVHVDFREAPARAFDVTATWLVIDRAADVLGWSPRTSLRSGLATTWAHLQAQRG